MAEKKYRGWEKPGAMEKAMATQAKKREMGIDPHAYSGDVKKIDQEYEQRVMQRVRYE